MASERPRVPGPGRSRTPVTKSTPKLCLTPNDVTVHPSAMDTPHRITPGKTTLTDLFPSNSKRMQYVRVMLKLMDPALHKLPWDQPLERAMLTKLQNAIQQDDRG